MNLSRAFLCLGWLWLAASVPALRASVFTAGDVVVEQIGDGSAALSSSATSVFLKEFLPGTAGQSSPVQTIALPNATPRPAANPFNLMDSGTATSDGYMTRSADGSVLVLPGYNGIPGDASIASSSAATVGRTIGLLDSNGVVNTSRSLNMLTGNNFRSVASADGTAFWAAGQPGMVFVSAAGTPASLSTVNTRCVEIFNGQLYFSTAAGTAGIYSLGMGLPVSGSPAAALLFTPNANNASPFAFALNSAADTLYVADDGSAAKGGIYKYTRSGATWSLAYQLISGTGTRGLTVDWSSANPVIIATTTATAANTLIKITDTGSSATATTLATAPANTVFRGVAFTPSGSLVTNNPVTNNPVAVGIPVWSQIKTVFVIAMENHNFTQPSPASSPQQISNNPAAPFLNSLITPGHTNAAQVSFCTHYYNAGIGVHGSEANCVWAEGGTDFGVHTDNDPSAASGNVFTNNHLARQLNAAGIAWKNYQEDLQFAASPTNSATGTAAALNPYYGTGQHGYAVKHNPLAFFSDTQTQNVFAFTNFLRDLTNNFIGRYNWITPNLYNDAHSALTGGFTYRGTNYTGDQAAVAQGDNFLSILIPKIMASSAYTNNGVIILWWDETEGDDTTAHTLPTIVLSPLCKGSAYAGALEYSHSSVLKTTEKIFGLPFLTNAIPAGETAASGSGYNAVTNVNDLGDLFVTMPTISSFVSTNNVFAIMFNTTAGQPWRLLAATNLTPPVVWSFVTNGVATNALTTATDANAASYSARYYRIATP